MTEKLQNYTPEQVQLMVEQYVQGVSVEQIAEQLGKSVRSIVAKLSREGVYKPRTKQAQVVRVTKASLVEQISMLVGKPSEQMESLEKANQDVLVALLEHIRRG